MMFGISPDAELVNSMLDEAATTDGQDGWNEWSGMA